MVLLRELEEDAPTWTERLNKLSCTALELWPSEAPHWRVAGPLVVPPIAVTASHGRTTGIDLRTRGGRGAGTSIGLAPVERARCLRALCAFAGGGPRLSRNLSPLMAMLVDNFGVSEASGGLAYQLPVEELQLCVGALGAEARSQESPLWEFAREAARRLSALQTSLSLREVLDLRSAFQRCDIETTTLDQGLRERLQELTMRGDEEDAGSNTVDVTATLACARAIGEPIVLRSTILRRALLPASLRAGTAALLLRDVLPTEGGPISTAHEFVIALAVGQVVAGARQLKIGEIAGALQGVSALQASVVADSSALRNEAFAVHQAARVLRALWPRVASKLAHFAPSQVSIALRCYWWQLLYSRQELTLIGVVREHPIVELALNASEDQRGRGRSRGRVKDYEATEDLKVKLVRPMLNRLCEMTLRHVGACLTALCPPVRPLDLLSGDDRVAVREAVSALFPQKDSTGSAQTTALQRDETEEEEGWWADFWAGEVRGLSVVELLELACGLREADPQSARGNETGSLTWWVLDSLLAELGKRLTRPGGERPSVELSHLTLVRMCRVMDLWRGHEVEDVLTHLLSSPESLRPLPTAHYVAVLLALADHPVPREVPLRLTAALLDSADREERAVHPEEWSDVLRVVRLLDESPSWERVVARVVHQLVPHVTDLPGRTLASFLRSLASRPLPLELRPTGISGLYSAPEQMPARATEAVRLAVEGGQWDFPQVVDVLESLGRLDWYADATVAAVLAQCARTPLLEAYSPLLLPLARSCAELRVHHAPLMHKIVLWYNWCYAYLRPKPLPADQLDGLLGLAEQLCELSFQSLELLGVLADNLENPNASSRQVLNLLAILSRFTHFPPAFKEACARLGSESVDSDLASLSNTELLNAFNIHLCAVFDGPAALKHWLTEDKSMRKFFQVHTSQKWYHQQDQERTTFLQSPAYLTLKQTAEEEGLDLRPSGPGEVYHVELVARDAKERLSALAGDPPMAIVCIRSKEQLRWYVPITAEGSSEGEQLDNRCHRFKFMFRGAVQKIRHLQAMGYRPVPIWMSEWRLLQTQAERSRYLRAAVGSSGEQTASVAFSPDASWGEDAYQ